MADKRSTVWFEKLESLLWGEGAQGPGAKVARVVGVLLWKFNADRGFLRASALTFSTLLSLVPLLAIMFSVLKGLGVQRRLEPLLLEHITVGNQEVTAQILGYVNRTDVGALGAAGLVALLFTVISVLSNVELSFNDIWQVRRGRTPVRKVADYVAVIVVTPVLLFVSLSVSTSLHSGALLKHLEVLGPALKIALRGLPLLAIWVAFTAVYVVMPNCRVPLGSAALGGVVGGSVWTLAEWSYIKFQFGVAKYNAIYGAMAQLPILFVWVYLSWCIVLLGAELAFVHQSPGRGRYLRVRHALWVPRLDAALGLLVAVARRFERGDPAPCTADLVTDLGLDPVDAERVVGRLVDDGLLVVTAEEDGEGYVPSRSPNRVAASELVNRVAHLEDVGTLGLETRLRSALARELDGVTWADLAMDPDR